MGRVAIITLAAALAASMAGCSRERADGLPIRLVGDPGIKRDAPFVTWGGVVVLDGVSRPVLSSAAPMMPATELVPQPARLAASSASSTSPRIVRSPSLGRGGARDPSGAGPPGRARV